MRRGMTVVLALVAVGGLGVSAAYGGPGCCASKGKAKGAVAAKGCQAAKSKCGIGEFPAMAMKVGEKSFYCPQTAAAVAKANGGKVVFVVAEEEYADSAEAMTALASASEAYVDKFLKIGCVVDGKVVYEGKKCQPGCCASNVKKASATGKDGSHAGQVALGKGHCGMTAKPVKEGAGHDHGHGDGAHAKKGGCGAKKATAGKVADHGAGHDGGERAERGGCGSHKAKDGKAAEQGHDKTAGGKFMVLGREFDNREAAVKARDQALSVIEKINMTYLVDGQAVGSSSEVCPNAKAAGKVQYVVNDEKTPCEITARVSLAKAKFAAASEVAEKLTEL